MDDYYPVEIFKSRYGGVYEGGDWIACVNCNMPGEAQGGDPTCAAFWCDPHAYIAEPHPYCTPGFGAGPTPATALRNAVKDSEEHQLAEEK